MSKPKVVRMVLRHFNILMFISMIFCMIKKIVISSTVVATTLPSIARAEFVVRSDLFLNSYYNVAWYTNLRARLSIAAGTRRFSAYPVFYYDSVNSDVTDLLYGGGAQFGENFEVVVDAGFMQRTYTLSNVRKKAYGYFGTIGVGYRFGQHFGLLLPLIAKSIVRGDLSKRLSVEAIPYLTMRLPL